MTEGFFTSKINHQQANEVTMNKRYKIYKAKEDTRSYTAKQVISMLPKKARELFKVGEHPQLKGLQVLIFGIEGNLNWIHPKYTKDRNFRKSKVVYYIDFSKYSPRAFAENYKGHNIFKVEQGEAV